jgi:hypothetical protein
MSRKYLALILLSSLGLAAPAAWNVYLSVVVHNWKASSHWNGEAYLLSSDMGALLAEGSVSRSGSSGVAAALATLLSWNGTATTVADIELHMASMGFGGQLSDFTTLVAEHGLEGHWLQAEPAALSHLKTPFLALLSGSDGRFILVRDLRGGYLYATDPELGNVLYPLESFAATWTGQAFAFPDPPPQPEEWR